jgi:hypothetical protein
VSDWDERDEPGHDPGPGYTACRGCGDEYPADELDGDWRCVTCAEDDDDEDRSFEADYHDRPIDGVGFANPGGNSALRAATRSNPRNLPCGNCGGENRLTPADKAAGYQCDPCADRAEMGGY